MAKSLLSIPYWGEDEIQKRIKRSEKYLYYQKQAEKFYDKLFQILDKEQTEWLNNVWTNEREIELEWGFLNFQAGVNFGLRLSSEAFCDKDLEHEEINEL